MGKRSQFQRVDKDFYPTPIQGFEPLIPHLPASFNFIEPCAGNGILIDHITSMTTGNCIAAYDLEPRRDDIIQADIMDMAVSYSVVPDYFITNPPWSRHLLHPIIEILSDIAPTWLLFDADWAHTKQSARFSPRLRKIVSVGRLKWIPNSKMTGKDNCAWYLFDKPSPSPTIFYGRNND